MSHKKTGKGKNRSAKSLGDITLNDFANSTVCKSRLKKSSSNVTKVLETFEEEKSWDEKADDDFDMVEQVDDEGNVTYVLGKVEPRRRKKTISNSEEVKETMGNDYPIDIWFLLSEYIRPEDVGRFAGICKTSFEVVSTAKFWFSLYRKYYCTVPGLPEKLEPECLVRKYSLRTSVIRALHYVYPPFIQKLKSIVAAMEVHPDSLKRRQCDSLWQIKQNTQWVFYFKLKEKQQCLLRHSKRTDFKLPDILEILDDVSANPDEHCRILRVTCKDFIHIPPVIGQVLTSVSLTLSQGLRHHRLKLMFGCGIQGYPSPDGGSCTTIILDPVINFKVLDWWHPLYPHRHNIEDLLDQD